MAASWLPTAGLRRSRALRREPPFPTQTFHPATAVIAAAALLCATAGAGAQDMEPRAFSASPINTNFVIAGYAYSSGGISFASSLPISGVTATINSVNLGYEHTFPLFGHEASFGIVLPYIEGDLSGMVGENSRQISRSGLGDLAMRFTANIFGGPALTPAEFAKRVPITTVGTSLTILAPTGDYNPQHLINISTNRWSFKPEIGISQPLGDWFADASAGVWLFTDNTDFLNGHTRSEDPLFDFQLHGGYNFRPGLWLSGDLDYYTGGETSVNGIPGHNPQDNWRYGFTLSVPLVRGFSVKLTWSSWLVARFGGNYDTVGLTLQYRWFGP
jgi:hypothetical protein